MSACRESFEESEELPKTKIKNREFERLFELLKEKYEQKLGDLMELNFKIEIQHEKDKKDSDEFDYFQAKNILLKKHSKLKNSAGQVTDEINTIEFQSRRTQYAFGMWILDDYESYWKGKKHSSRVKFQQLLERIEYQYILDFTVFKLRKRIQIAKN